MEESDELKTKATASTPATEYPNQEVGNNSSKSREEGELSSSDDDEFPGGPASQSAGMDPVQVASVNKNAEFVEAGKSFPMRNPASSVDVPSTTYIQPYNHKGFEKNRVPFMISFSDDDSGSDSQECRQGKTFETNGDKIGVVGARRPPASLLSKSQMLRRTTGNDTKMMSRKVSLSRTFISSMAQINGASSRNGGPLPVDRSSRAKKINNINKNKPTGEHGCNQNIHLNSSKLQDLRQLIAIRENELKLKATQQNKETVSDSCRDYSVMNLSNDTARICRETSDDFLHFKQKEPYKKRLKVSEPHSCLPNTDGRQDMPAVESMLAAEKPVLDNCGQQNIVDRRCCDKKILFGTTQSGSTQWKRQEENHGPVSSADLQSGVKQGTAIIINSSQCKRITKLGDPSAQIANRTTKTFPKKSHTVELKHLSGLICHHRPSSLPNSSVPDKATSGHNSMRSSELHEKVRSGDKAVKPLSNDTRKACSLQRPDSNLEMSDGSLNNASFWNSLGKVNISGNSNMDIQSLLEIEESYDKELDEAQEFRHQCEIEERNTRKAYRKAQRTLIEANARCSYLYRKREQYSAHFRSIMMEDSSLSWSSRLHNHIGAALNSLTNMPEVNMHMAPALTHQMQPDFNIHNQHGYDSNVGCASGTLQNLSDRNEDGQNLASDPCSEPDASTSEPQKDNGVATVFPPLNDFNNSPNENEETFPFDHKDSQFNLDRQRKEEFYEERRKDVIDESKTFDSSQDSLLLEASLRSQLFSRLGIKNTLKKRDSSQDVEPIIETGAQNDSGGEKMETNMESIAFSAAEKDQHFDFGGTDSAERNISEIPVQINNQCHVEKFSSNYASFSEVDPLNSWLIGSVTFLCPILRSAFGHMEVSDASSLVHSQISHHQIHTSDTYDQKNKSVGRNGIEPIIMSSNSTGETVMDICISEVGSYTSGLAIDPFWPLCMYELRGKCNNDECSWQHVRDYSCKNMNHDKSHDADCQVGSAPQGGKFNDATNLSKCPDFLSLAPPAYLVCLDILKADLHPYRSVLARSVGQCWWKCFSASLVLSSLLPTALPSEEPFLHGTEACIEVHGGWSRQSSYFHSRNGTMSQLDQCLGDNDQSLEMALLNLNQEVNKQKGLMEALKVLAQALESDPTSVVLWIVYLHIYYSNKKSIGKDDMFHCAIEYNEGSYELWLMYINSRVRLDDRLAAYDTALSALCGHASASVKDAKHASACILDLFLQMMNCLCISGKVGNAIQKIYGFYPYAKKSDEPHHMCPSDILTCLTICDKCIFWVCCVYVVVYRKLPDTIMQQCECQKELSAIEWPSAHLTVDEKQQAVTLMEMAVDSIALYIDSESLESETTLRSAYQFALNHIRCMSVLEGLECSRKLLDKYVKLYPSCLELVLMSARAREHDYGDLNFVGFEESLSNWSEEVPGTQCIWNQYAEFALRNGRFDFARELMDRWFHSVWKVQCSQNEIIDSMDGEISISSQTDLVFGLLNLSLHKILQNDHVEARIAIDKALKAASAKDYKHCVREHAMFLLSNGLQFKEDAPASGMLTILNGYLVDIRAFPASEPLSRKFIQSIKKPRVQLLVSNLLTPVSSDSSLVNLILEVWQGPSLLPQLFGKLINLVNFVESIMEIVPSNYQLAISLCKLLSEKFKNSVEFSASVSFWAISVLVNTLFQAVPVAPEHVWVEATNILHNLTDIQSISESFHKRALSIYPFSMKLWESYLSLSQITGHADAVIEAARERGIEL